MAFVEDLKYDARSLKLIEALESKILVLDGAMGTEIQKYGFEEADFRGEEFADWNCRLKGCNDVLAITQPEAIERIHTSYLDAGAMIIETDSFNSNKLSLADYGLSENVREINLAAAKVARKAADSYMASHPGELRWVAGSVGPTSKSLSMSQGVDETGAVNWDMLVDAYMPQFEALIEGGVDIFQIETIFDALNAKAAVWCARRAMEKYGKRVPIILSLTLTESGRTLSGQTLDAAIATLSHAEPIVVGLNCSFGADGMMKYVEALQQYPFAVVVYPNAGLPNAMGQYDETSEKMVGKVKEMFHKGYVNIIGGCCGTTPEHIRLIAEEASKHHPRPIPVAEYHMVLAGLESLDVDGTDEFIQVGERCNVAGSRKFLRLIKEKSIDEAISVAASQVAAGAKIVDVNLDDSMLDAVAEMSAFLSRIGVEPEVARVPVMIDSSDWNVIVEGLKRIQGRPVVNSISLKEGEEKFLDKARHIKEMGAAVIVMAFDENGQADTFERRIEVCRRAYDLLVDKVGFKGCDIVFDPNVLAVATGIESHSDYAVDFIRSVKWIKSHLPGAKVSGGVSNLSFSFRGNNQVREAMHSLFLRHARLEGMDMAIVNVSTSVDPDGISPELAKAIDDVLLNRDVNATDRLVDIAEKIKAESTGTPVQKEKEHSEAPSSPRQRIVNMLVSGSVAQLEQALEEAMKECGSALAVVDGPLMEGMNRVGELFGSGKMFLPQVVKSARTMKQAVNWLTPYIEEEKHNQPSSSSGKMVIATVKGDVHDIGKNIVSVIMNCNGFDVVDMGVMVPGEEIVNRAVEENADFIGLSGLITPSLEEMCNVAKLMESKRMRIPLLIGGATTSALHTAVKIAPCYGGPVVYTRDAAMMPSVAQRLVNPSSRDKAVRDNEAEQNRLRHEYASASLISIETARKNAPEYSHSQFTPAQPGVHTFDISISEAKDMINWRAFLAAWKLDASFAEIMDIKGCDHCKAQWLASLQADKVKKGAEAMQLLKEAVRAIDDLESRNCKIKARVALLPAHSDGDDIVVTGEMGELALPMLRRQLSGETSVSLADFVAPCDDWIGLFAVTSGKKIEDIISGFKSEGDDYKAILYQTVADRLVEAATELMHLQVRRSLWGYAGNEEDNLRNLLRQYYQGIRPAVGYPSMPDQSLIFELDKVLDYASVGITLTEHGAMAPAASTTGLIISHPDSRYFMLGEIGEDQLEDYARRRGMMVDDLRAYLSNSIMY
ncbi:MAG: methionine synthase [Lachnospiraceae bacterium]|nr:methionine synthase [Lachnospiraceae bacterium]